MFCAKNDKELTPQEKVNQEWDAMAGEWDDVAVGYAKGFYKLLWKETGLDPTASGIVVDFGCGSGLLTDRLRTAASKVLALDASTKMVEMVHEKIQTCDWTNVQAAAVQLSNLESANETDRKVVQEFIDASEADLVVASSVLTFIPDEDIAATMAAIGKMLKPGGLFCHSDWPKSEAKHPNAMTDEKARRYFALAGLEPVSTRLVEMPMGGGEKIEVFVGVAKKL